MKKRMGFRLISVALLLTMLLFTAAPASAAFIPRELIASFNADGNDYMIYVETGKYVVEEYFFNVLMRRATISMSDPDHVIIERVSGNTRAAGATTISIADYVDIGGNQPYTPSGDTLLGNVTFYGYRNGAYQYYGAQCTYRITLDGATTFTLNEDVRDLLHAVSIIFAVCAGIFSAMTNVATFGQTVAFKSIIAVLVEEVLFDQVEDWVADRYFPTFSCHATEYEMTISDRTNTGNYRVLTGGRYTITDVNSSYQGAVYTEGYTPDDWETDEFAAYIHQRLFMDGFDYRISQWW